MTITEYTGSELLQTLKDQLVAIRLPGDPGQPLFEVVEFFMNQNLRDALKKMVITQSRVAIIVPSGDRFERLSESGPAGYRRFMAFDILVADRDWVDGQGAAFGSADQVGVFKMKDLVLHQLLSGSMEPRAIPLESNPIEVVDEKAKDSPGRQTWVLSFEAKTGEGYYEAPARRSRF